MGMSVGTAGRGGRGHRRRGRHHGLMSEINVTPFVDVMLVLLIIFMVSAPLATVSIRLDLPPATPPPEGVVPEPPTFISIALGGDIYVATGEEQPVPVELENLDGELFGRLGSRSERIMIRADADVLYGDFMSVMNNLQDKGWFQIGLINEDIE